MTRPHPATNATRFTVGVAVFAWLLAYVAALPLQGILISITGHGGEKSDSWPISLTVLSVLCLWIPFVVALVVVSRRWGQPRWTPYRNREPIVIGAADLLAVATNMARCFLE
jgi:hypothetical protein